MNTPLTVPAIRDRKTTSSKIVALTAYDYTTAAFLDREGVDVILVGDSLSAIVQGEPTTLPVTLEEMIYHCRCVSRGARHALVVGDLPFLSYQASPEDGIRSAGRLLKEGRVSAVKLEGGVAMHETIKRLVAVDIPVMGHVGLTPQSFHRMGGHRIQGRTHGGESGSWERIIEDAQAVESAGAFAVVIEGVPAELGTAITKLLSIPTIGIGAGPDCDGQILVTHDMLGLTQSEPPKFVKQFGSLGAHLSAAVQSYKTEVQKGAFPAKEHTFAGHLRRAQ